jgi:hypothetical protein
MRRMLCRTEMTMGNAESLAPGILIFFTLSCVLGWRIAIPLLLLYCLARWATIARTELNARCVKQFREQLPCKHGTSGAVVEPNGCQLCVAERDVLAEETRLRRALYEQQQAEQRLRAYREYVEKIKLPGYLRSMDPRQFEELICNLFRQMGYHVEDTPYVADGGSDGYLYKDGKKTVLQCKRVKGSVGEPVLRDLYGTMHGNHAQFGLVVTTGRVSHPAREWVRGKAIRIIELDELRRLLEENFPCSALVPPDFAPAPAGIPYCPRCHAKLRTVDGKHGLFFGCTRYPNCKYTRSIASTYVATRRRALKGHYTYS